MKNKSANRLTIYIVTILLLAGQQMFSQIDSTFYINGYFGLGVASPLGALKSGEKGDFEKAIQV